MNKILVVEDESHIADGIRFNLEAEGFFVDVAADGEIALRLLLEEKKVFDAIVLDVMLPKFSGFEVAQKLRETENYTPILMLTARGRPEDVLQGFEAGTDDYLPKPFELNIFLARLKGLLRRQKWSRHNNQADESRETDVFAINDKTIDFANLELKTKEETIQLTLMEAKLLRHLIRKHGNAVSRKEILEEVWDLHEETDTRAIDNFIVRLRRYLEDDPSSPKILETVRGIGYRFVKEEGGGGT
ncbi:MAG: response regulator transcription factor [Acidobacteria bacterium]|nr:response regulator transcription factor [Acidobacteriota bacterium]